MCAKNRFSNIGHVVSLHSVKFNIMCKTVKHPRVWMTSWLQEKDRHLKPMQYCCIWTWIFQEHRILRKKGFFLTLVCSRHTYFYGVLLKQVQVLGKMPSPAHVKQYCGHVPKPLDVVLEKDDKHQMQAWAPILVKDPRKNGKTQGRAGSPRITCNIMETCQYSKAVLTF